MMFSTLMFQYDLSLSITCVVARRKAAMQVIETAEDCLRKGYEAASDEEVWEYLFFSEGHWQGDF